MKKIFVLFFVLFAIHDVRADYIRQDIIDGCDVSVLRPTQNYTTKFIPKFRVKTFVCDTGYFLPANTDQCVQCPIGYTCPGGTFDFNSTKVQGINKQRIITNNLSNVCSTNFTSKYKPIFRPNTINLDWYNGNEIVAQTSCTYGEKITLPNITPTKTGYIFGGWRLRKTSDQNN